MKNFSVIVCNSGRGHLKRVLWILDGLCRLLPERLGVDVFVDTDKLGSFDFMVSKLKKSEHQIRFYDIKSDVFNYEKEFMARYGQFFSRADHVWSDNLVFPLKYCPGAFLTGQFLWSEIINDQDFKNFEMGTLSEHRPRMLGTRYFATPAAQRLTNFTGVGVYNYFPIDLDNTSAKAILLACGGTAGAQRYFEDEMAGIVKTVAAVPEEVTIFVEPKYFERFSARRNVQKAAFTEEMFSQVKAAVIRPGLGTVCDVLSKGGRVFSFMEEENFEIKYNASVLEKLGLGRSCHSIGEAIASAVMFINERKARQEHLENIRKIDFNGLNDVIEKIKRIIQPNYACT